MTDSSKASNPKEAAGATKLPLHLLSGVAKAHWSMAQFSGLVKYGAWNWRDAGVRASTYIAAIERHLEKWKAGQELDPVDGTHHLGNIMACAAILLESQHIGNMTDDRPPATVDLDALFEELNKQLPVLREKYAHLQPYHYTRADTDRLPHASK